MQTAMIWHRRFDHQEATVGGANRSVKSAGKRHRDPSNSSRACQRAHNALAVLIGLPSCSVQPSAAHQQKVRINQRRTSVMKKLVTIVALAASVLTTPALAHTTHVAGRHAAYNTASRHAVYNTEGRYLGSDPDPAVRQMMAFDHVGNPGF
jgi:hypothetical protein